MVKFLFLFIALSPCAFAKSDDSLRLRLACKNLDVSPVPANTDYDSSKSMVSQFDRDVKLHSMLEQSSKHWRKKNPTAGPLEFPLPPKLRLRILEVMDRNVEEFVVPFEKMLENPDSRAALMRLHDQGFNFAVLENVENSGFRFVIGRLIARQRIVESQVRENILLKDYIEGLLLIDEIASDIYAILRGDSTETIAAAMFQGEWGIDARVASFRKEISKNLNSFLHDEAGNFLQAYPWPTLERQTARTVMHSAYSRIFPMEFRIDFMKSDSNIFDIGFFPQHDGYHISITPNLIHRRKWYRNVLRHLDSWEGTAIQRAGILHFANLRESGLEFVKKPNPEANLRVDVGEEFMSGRVFTTPEQGETAYREFIETFGLLIPY